MARFPTFSLGRREKSILQGVEDHLSLVRQTVVAYQSLVAAVASGDSSDSLVDGVFNAESKAKQMRRDLSTRIAEGAFFGGIREDILNLIQANDDIADTAKDAARLLMIGVEGDEKTAEFLKSPHMAGFQTNLLSAVTALEFLIQGLQVDKKTALSRVQAVEDFEEAGDVEKNELLKELFTASRSMDPVSVIELRDFIFTSDDIADDAEDASDVVLVLVAKGYD
jgi:uncharacterized protein